MNIVYIYVYIHYPSDWLPTSSYLGSPHALTLFEIMFGCLYEEVTVCINGCKIGNDCYASSPSVQACKQTIWSIRSWSNRRSHLTLKPFHHQLNNLYKKTSNKPWLYLWLDRNLIDQIVCLHRRTACTTIVACKISYLHTINLHLLIRSKLSYLADQGGASLRMDVRPSNQAVSFICMWTKKEG
jgi:hypothetical protein